MNVFKKIFGTFESGSSGMFCNVIEVLYCVSTSEKLNVKARFDASVMLDNMIRYQHVLTAITYLRIMEITSALSKYLQTFGLNFINAFNMVEATKKELNRFIAISQWLKPKLTILFNMPMKFWKNVDVMSWLKAAFLLNGFEKVKMKF